MNSCVEFGKAQGFSPVDYSSGWEVGDMLDTEAVIRDVKQEVEVDEDWTAWASPDSAAAPEKSFGTLQSKMTVSDILRGVKVREDTLQSAVARLGGGKLGLHMLMEHVNHWALKSQDEEDTMVAIKREIVHLGMPLTPQQHYNPEISTTSGDGYGFDVKGSPRSKKDCATSHIRVAALGEQQIALQGTCEILNHSAAYTRALRKSHIVRQRGQTRTQQRHHPTKIESENQSRQCRLSSSDDHRKQVDMESEFSDANGTGYDFLFKKVLRASDVSSLGRIILPKKDAERHLPLLVEKDGILLSFQDYHCGKFWTARYRFWPNNKSRMYLLENIGDFVNFHHLQDRDLLLCYRNYQGGGYVLRVEKFPLYAKTPAGNGLCSKGAQASPASEMKTITTVMPATCQLVEEEIPCGTDLSNLATSSFDSWNCTLGETGDASPTSEMKTFTATMPAAYQLVEGEIPSGTHNANLANSSSDSSNCTWRETSGAKYCQDGDRGHQHCFSQQQSGNSPWSGDVRTDFPASYEPLVNDEDLCPGVTMLYLSNLKHRYLDETHIL